MNFQLIFKKIKLLPMDTRSLIQIPGYVYNEYLLVLSPHEELWDKIMKVKEKFHDDYKASTALWGKPHITLVNFLQFKMMEAKIVNRLKTIDNRLHK